MPSSKPVLPIVIIGAGPAGLGCAYELAQGQNRLPGDKSVIVLDKNDRVGGLSRTQNYAGCLFDVGPHRFFTKNKEVLALWRTILGRDFRSVRRLTRILYQNKLFLYPIELKDVITKLGWKESLVCLVSFVRAKWVYRTIEPRTFEEWITKHFGQKLYSVFFKTYTEKVWGIPCNQIGAEWAAQRIKNLNFVEVVRGALFGSRGRKAKSLVDTFYYPVKGAGSFYERLAKIITKSGYSVRLQTSVTKIHHKNGRIRGISVKDNTGTKTIATEAVFSSMPLTHFIFALDPLPPKAIIHAAKKLYYRDHITVNLIVRQTNLFSDNWIYVHSPDVLMARVANYNNFSSRMHKNRQTTALSVEYFVFKGDAVWSKSDEELMALAVKEMAQVGLLDPTKVEDGFVVRETESYPTYYTGHAKYFDRLKDYVKTFTNLELIGRGGMYKYDNQDHAIYSGLLAARNYVSGTKHFDVWQINEDAEYLESGTTEDQSA